jgi:hypothetical protein
VPPKKKKEKENENQLTKPNKKEVKSFHAASEKLAAHPGKSH